LFPIEKFFRIHSNSVDGPVADKVKLGDRVFHRWRCDERYALKVGLFCAVVEYSI